MLVALMAGWSTATASMRAIAPPDSAERTAEHRAALAGAVDALRRPTPGTRLEDPMVH